MNSSRVQSNGLQHSNTSKNSFKGVFCELKCGKPASLLRRNTKLFTVPGDLNYDGICNAVDLSISYFYINENGPPRNPGGITWEAQACQDWGFSQANGYNIKHHDCNGNGNINSQDINAINLNYGKTHSLPFGVAATPPTVYTNTDFKILLQPINQVSNNNDTIVMNVVMESKTGQNLEIFCGHFSIDYPNIVTNADAAIMAFESQSWLGDTNVDLLAKS